MVLPDERNRRLSPKRRLKNKLLVSIIGFSAILLVFLLGCFGFYLIFLKNDSLLTPEERKLHSQMTSKQISVLNQLKDELSENFTHNYMKNSGFLVPFLKEKDWNFEDTSKMLSDHMNWRNDNEVEASVLDTDYKQDFPYYTDGFDRDGRLVMSIDFGKWKVKNTIASGEGERFLKFVYRLFEQHFNLNVHGFAQNKTQRMSQNTNTQILIVANLQGFNMMQQGCFHCIRYYLRALLALQENYPGYKDTLHKVILINTPEDFDFILSLAPDGIEDLLEVYGPNKSKWTKVVLRLIAEDQVRPQFGGTKTIDSN